MGSVLCCGNTNAAPSMQKKSADDVVVPTSESAADVEPAVVGKTQRVALGAGCYWGTEKYINTLLHKKIANLPPGRVSEGNVGFMGPKTAHANPTYSEVCSGTSGQVEVYDFEYVGGAPFFEELIKYFFMFHDPTVMNAQENDKGTQVS